jgi:hypothetical protein
MNRIRFAMTLALFAFLGFAGTALAAGAVASEDGSLLELARPVLEAVLAGQYPLAALLAIVFAVAALRRLNKRPDGSVRVPFLASDAGGVLLACLAAAATVAAGAVSAGAGWSLALLGTAAGAAVMAMGGFVGAKKLLLPLAEWLEARAPKWAQPLFKLALWVFDRPDPVELAEAAGDAAVAANPTTGVDGVVGSPRDAQ